MPDKVVVITGASSGIGAALAELLATRATAPASVVLVARRADALQAVAARCAGRAHVIVGDVTKRGDVQRVVAETLARFGRIDVWVNNAGQGITRAPSQLTDEDIDAMIQSNVKSVVYGTQEVLPHFKERNAGQIINVSSMLGRIPFSVIRSAYAAAKHYVNALTATFREELKESHPGIVFTLFSPGVVRTEFGKNARHGGPDSRELPYSQSAEEVAAVMASLIDQPRPDVYSRAGARQRVLDYYAGLGTDP
jgi:NADP-dependent 3-hydroxy acid dehydrogenase YdfG